MNFHSGVLEALTAARPTKVNVTAPVIDAILPRVVGFDEDLKAAGIPKTDETGLVVISTPCG